MNYAVEEQKTSEEEDDLGHLVDKNLALEKPQVTKEHSSDSVVLREPDHLETLTDLESDQVPPPIKKHTKPHSVESIKDPLDIITGEKLDNIADLEVPNVNEVNVKPSLSDVRAETVQVNLTNDGQTTDTIKSDKIPRKHSKTEIIPDRQESFGIDKQEKIESAMDLDIPPEPEMDQADLQIANKDKEMVNVESKQKIEATDELA